MSSASVRLFVVSNRPLVTNSFRRKESNEGFSYKVVGDSSINDLDDKLKQLEADVLILDNEKENNEGIKALKKIRKAKPKVRIVFMILYQDFDFAVQAIHSGAKGVVSKEYSVFEIIRIIKYIYEGDVIIFLKKLFENLCGEIRSCLTEREMNIFCRMVKGFSNNEIVESLFLGLKSVEKEKTNIYKKLKEHEVFNGLDSKEIGRILREINLDCTLCNGKLERE